MVRITGNDDISLKAYEMLKNKCSLKDLMKLDVSLDQAKILSRFYKMIQKLDKQVYRDKLINIGIKALVLTPLFKTDDIEGVEDILNHVNSNIKRDDLKLLVKALEEKRDRIEVLEIEIKYKFKNIEESQRAIDNKIEESKNLQKQLKKESKIFKDCSDEANEFLTRHLGKLDLTLYEKSEVYDYYNERRVKAKELYNKEFEQLSKSILIYERLEYSWQSTLKRKGIIEFNEHFYVYVVKDLDYLIKNTERRIKHNNYMEFNEDRVPQNGFGWSGSYKQFYYNVSPFSAVEIAEKIVELKKDMKTLDKKKEDLHKELEQLKKKSPLTYIEKIKASNQVSNRDLESHTLLQEKAMRWLYKNEYVSIMEYTKENLRFDVVGYNKDDKVVIIEAKASIEDFRRDDKYINYMKYCDEFYFIFKESIYFKHGYEIREKLKSSGSGIIILKNNKRDIEVIVESNIDNSNNEDTREIIFNVARQLNKKLLFGL